MNKKLTAFFLILFAVALFLTLSLSLEDGGVQAAPRPPESAPAATPATFST